LGVGSTIAGQVLVGAIAGAIFALRVRRNSGRRATVATISIFVLLPILSAAIALWPMLGTNYRGLPIDAARLITLIGLALCFFVFERTLVAGFHFLVRARSENKDREFSPAIGRRALILGGLGMLIAGGSAGLIRKLYRAATFSYDGLQYKGRIVQPITPNESFYCVTKNVVDPRVNVDLWHLEVTGLVQNSATYRFQDLQGFTPVGQETTLMCISNGLDAGLISNAVWKGVPLHDLLDPAVPVSNAARVRLWGVDNYSDTIPLEKAMDATTLVAYEMNGAPLPHRHGYPVRVVVPGYFGEKHVKWLTRIEVTDANAKGFYETQGWGPDFIAPTRSRIDVPDHESRFSIRELRGPIEVKGVAFGGDRGISRVELSFDDGESFQILKSIRGWVLHESVHFQVPKIDIYSRIDHVLSHAVKEVVRRDRLDHATFVLRAVVAKRGRAIKFLNQTRATAGDGHAEPTQNERASSNRWAEFAVFAFRFFPSEKMKSGNERSLKNKNTQGKADQRD